MSPRIFSQSKNRVFALNFRSSSETVSPLARSFSARWLPMNPFPPVIRILEILFHHFTADATGGTLRPGARCTILRYTGSSRTCARTSIWVFQTSELRCWIVLRILSEAIVILYTNEQYRVREVESRARLELVV